MINNIINMTNNYDKNYIGFDGSCIVAMDNGEQEFVRNIKKGDKILGGTVELVLRIKNINNKAEYCKTDSGLLISNSSLIKYKNNFIYSNMLYEQYSFDSEYKYTFLLKKEIIDDLIEIKRDISNCIPLNVFNKLKPNTLKVYYERPKSFVINNIEVLALGYGNQEFFGSEKIVNRLKKCKGWNNGLITFEENEKLFVKNKNGEIIDINIIYES